MKFSSKKKEHYGYLKQPKNESQTIKFWTINGLSTNTVAVHEISTLGHKLVFFFWGGKSMENWGLIEPLNATKSNAPLEWLDEKDSPHTQIHAGQ